MGDAGRYDSDRQSHPVKAAELDSACTADTVIQVNVAAIGTGDGYFARLSAAPSFQPLRGSGFSLEIPLDVGMGFDDFYDTDADRSTRTSHSTSRRLLQVG